MIGRLRTRDTRGVVHGVGDSRAAAGDADLTDAVHAERAVRVGEVIPDNVDRRYVQVDRHVMLGASTSSSSIAIAASMASAQRPNISPVNFVIHFCHASGGKLQRGI